MTVDKHGERIRSGASTSSNIIHDQTSIEGYKLNSRRYYLTYLYTVLSLGGLQLVFYWRPDWKLKMTHTICTHRQAEKILVTDCYGQVFVEKVECHLLRAEHSNFFIHKKVKYIWDEKAETFIPLRAFPESIASSILHSSAKGLSEEEQKQQQVLFGENLIKVNVRPVIWLILNEALNPFYVFQLYTTIVWFIQDYILYTSAVMFLAAISIGITVYENRKQSKALRNSVKSSSVVQVYRGNNVWECMSSVGLVPGDVILVRAPCVMECDAVLLSGAAVVNESMLTGESVPVSKMPLPNNPDIVYRSDEQKRHTLFSGTKVLITHSEDKVTAIVIHTGYATTKGELVRSILFPKPVDMKFYSDSMKFLWVSFALGLLAMVYTTTCYILNQSSIKEIIISALDIITFVIPPSLPATITIGNLYAQRRLKQHKIFCLSNKFINLSGTLNMICFDKTGTLTHDGLDMDGVVPVKNGIFQEMTSDLHDGPDLLSAMVCSHSLELLDEEEIGDPLDLVMFKSTSWKLVDPQNEVIPSSFPVTRLVSSPDDDCFFNLVHQYPFLSALQRMSVIVEDLREQDFITVYMKGAPETISALCVPDTVPEDLASVLETYTGQGFRVIAFAQKSISAELSFDEIQNMQRHDVECHMTFLGLIIMQNRLKPETMPAIQILHSAGIRTVMVTGDNLLTAIHTASCSGMIRNGEGVAVVSATPNRTFTDVSVEYREVISPHRQTDNCKVSDDNESSQLLLQQQYHFAMEGKTYTYMKTFKPELLDKLTQRGVVFARMLPELKVRLVEQYQEIGYIVGMCGDGANDCGALKTANTGISLSTAEASVAAPFTSSQNNIQCVPTLIREGRCALVSSFGLFKYVLACSWIFCIAVLILYKISCDMTDMQYLYSDLVLIVIPSLLIANIGPYPGLVEFPPPPTLTRLTTITSLIGYIATQTAFLVGLSVLLQHQPWFVPWDRTSGSFESYENSLIFTAMCLSFAFASIIFCQGPPYRKRFYSSKTYTLVVLVINALSICVLIYPPDFILRWFQIQRTPISYNLLIFAISVTNLLLSLLFEDMFVNIYIHRKFLPWIRKRFGHKHIFEILEEDMLTDPYWPPVCTEHASIKEVGSDVSKTCDSKQAETKEVSFRTPVQLRTNKAQTENDLIAQKGALLETNLATLTSPNKLSVSTKSLPVIENEGEAIRVAKQWNRRSYIDDNNRYF